MKSFLLNIGQHFLLMNTDSIYCIIVVVVFRFHLNLFYPAYFQNELS